MKVYNYNSEGFFTHSSVLDDSDKCQLTGDWIIPGMATEKEPLKAKQGYEVKFNGTEWGYIKILTVEERKIKGEIPLAEGEAVQDKKLIVIEKPDQYHIWNGKEWEFNPEIRKAEITSELEKLDFETIRPLRAILSDLGTDFDKSKLAELETKAKDLRNEMKNLVVE